MAPPSPSRIAMRWCRDLVRLRPAVSAASAESAKLVTPRASRTTSASPSVAASTRQACSSTTSAAPTSPVTVRTCSVVLVSVRRICMGNLLFRRRALGPERVDGEVLRWPDRVLAGGPAGREVAQLQDPERAQGGRDEQCDAERQTTRHDHEADRRGLKVLKDEDDNEHQCQGSWGERDP